MSKKCKYENDSDFERGQRIVHPEYGEGVFCGTVGDSKRAVVKFDKRLPAICLDEDGATSIPLTSITTVQFSEQWES